MEITDLKLNEVPVDTSDETPASEQTGQRETKPRAGLSIKDTIAGTSTLSVGSRGVDTSGVSAGAGAGAGMTSTTPSASAESPGPTIVPGSRGSGTTVRGANNTVAPSSAMPATNESLSTEGNESAYTDRDVADEAYQCWLERGCPEGSPEVDWQLAQQRLKVRKAGA